MKQRKPRDPGKYLHPVLAYSRLANTALEHILWNRFGTRVRWSLKVQYFYDATFKPGENQKIVPHGFTISSGDDSPETETLLTGYERQPAKTADLVPPTDQQPSDPA